MNTAEGEEKNPEDETVAGVEAAEGDEDGEIEEAIEGEEKEIDDGEENDVLIPRLRLSKAQKQDVYEAFRLLDNVGNGLVDASKFKIVLYALGYETTPEQLKEIIATVGETPYGKISLSDFAKLIMNKSVEKDCESDLIKSFLCFDTDKIGEIYPENIKTVAQLIDDDSNDEEINEMFSAADESDNGFLDIDSFLNMMNRCVSLKIEKEYE